MKRASASRRAFASRVLGLIAVLVGTSVLIFGSSRPSSFKDITYTQSMTAELLDSVPAPEAEDEEPTSRGPAVRLEPVRTIRSGKDGRSVQWYLGCDFQIADEGGWYWNFTYEARIYDPADNQIRYHSAFAYKPSFRSSLGLTITDPVEGNYRCTVDWWVEGYYLGQGQDTVSVSYLVPTGETTLENAWSGLIPTAYKWRGRLEGGSFVGRQVHEAEGGNDVDTCYFPNSIYPRATGLTIGEPWDVGVNSEYGDDTVGWNWEPVDYYRVQGRAPCHSETDQIMTINRPGTSWASYKTNRLKMGFTMTTVWSERDGHAVSKNW